MTHGPHCYFFSCSVGILFAQQGLVSLITLGSLWQCCLHCILLLNESQVALSCSEIFLKSKELLNMHWKWALNKLPCRKQESDRPEYGDRHTASTQHLVPVCLCMLLAVLVSMVYGLNWASLGINMRNERNWIPPSRRCASARTRTWLKTHRLYVFYTISHFSVC
jgi:hypothetical protein